jgi:acyl-CoA synthetase (AMP-forming)/AMP-acid ligase II
LARSEAQLEAASLIWPDGWPPTMVDVLQRWALERPDQHVLSFITDGAVETESLTYGELDARARAIACHLTSRMAPGDRALLLFPPTLEFVAAFFGCLYAGVLAVPAYPPSVRTLGRLLAIVGDSEPTAILVPSSIGDLVRTGLAAEANLAGIPVIETDLVPGSGDDWARPDIDQSSIAFLQYTSGSIGSPKGVIVTHDSLLHNERMIARAFGHDGELVGVSWLPVYHDMGLIGQVLQPLFLGGRGYLMSPVEFLKRPVTWLKAISTFRAQTSGGPNFGYERCLLKVTEEERRGLDLSSWKVAYNGAEPIRAETMERFAAVFSECGFDPKALYPCFGLAEATLFVTGKPPEEAPNIRSFDIESLERRGRAEPATGEGSRALVSAGQPWLDQEVVVVDPITHVELAEGTVGEIWVAGGNVAAGYWNHPVETEETFGGVIEGSGGGRFLRTGDLGFMLDGELFVTGRIKDLIIIRGRNYYPQDIERTVSAADPHIRPGCGVAFARVVDGEERLVVVQEVDPNGQPLDAGRVLTAARLSIASRHDLRAHTIVLIPRGEIPKTSSGKLQRARTRELFEEGALPVLATSILPARES